MMLFAESQGFDWSHLVVSLINAGFAGLVAWYLLTKAIPRMQESFMQELKAARDHYDGEVEKRRTDHKDSLSVVVKHCEDEAKRHDETVKVELSLMTSALKDQREVLEEVRDGNRRVADHLQFLSNKA